MKVIYSSYWGSYLAMVAASLHIGRIKTKKDFTLHLFNNVKDHELGELIPVGKDDEGREVFVVGAKKSGTILEKTLKGVAETYGFSADSVVFIDLNHFYNSLLGLGVFLIRRLNLVSIGTRLVVKGIDYVKLKKVVDSVKYKPCIRE